jgi:hypothetical protein
MDAHNGVAVDFQMSGQWVLWPVLAGVVIVGLYWFKQRLVGLRRPQSYVVVDGSNVMHWKGKGPDLSAVQEVIKELKRRGHTPGVIFDANAGYKLLGRYSHDGEMARMLHLPPKQAMVVDKGAVADQWILAAARELGARIVTNDRFRDWAETHPEVVEPGFLIRGEFRNGKVWLGLEDKGNG